MKKLSFFHTPFLFFQYAIKEIYHNFMYFFCPEFTSKRIAFLISSAVAGNGAIPE